MTAQLCRTSLLRPANGWLRYFIALLLAVTVLSVLSAPRPDIKGRVVSIQGRVLVVPRLWFGETTFSISYER
jgi:hypothetical protein